jgi:trehalose 6-phosphate phosphatase
MSVVGPELYAALEQVAKAGTLLVASDFDGALAEFTVDPEDTAPAPGGMEALRLLAALPATHVAVVSGRDVPTLKSLTSLGSAEPIVLIGSHGAESSNPEVTAGARLDEARKALLDELTEQVAGLIDEHPGARLERKRAAVAVHTRGLARESAEAALTEAELLGSGREEVRVLSGKSVVELSVSHADKGTALGALARLVAADATFYTGDDVTDEDAFRALDPLTGDVTVKVGPGETAAAHRVDTVSDVVAVLHEILALREAAVEGRSGPAVGPQRR